MISSAWEPSAAGPLRRTYTVEPPGRELLAHGPISWSSAAIPCYGCPAWHGNGWTDGGPSACPFLDMAGIVF